MTILLLCFLLLNRLMIGMTVLLFCFGIDSRRLFLLRHRPISLSGRFRFYYRIPALLLAVLLWRLHLILLPYLRIFRLHC